MMTSSLHLRQLQLEPLLDDITLPEEIAWLPWKDVIAEASFLLLALPTRYYVYVLKDGLFDAGTTLKDVYEGLRNTTTTHSRMEGSGWPLAKPHNLSWWLAPFNWFPVYHRGELVDPVEHFFPGPSDSEDDDDDDE
jgi:hypothetical protein